MLLDYEIRAAQQALARFVGASKPADPIGNTSSRSAKIFI